MKTCSECGKQIANRTLINGKVVNTQRRKFCYDCSPFGSGNNQLVKGSKTKDEVEKIVDDRKERKREVVVESQKRLRKKRKHDLIQLLGGKCVNCGYNKCERALEFHHLDPTQKTFGLATLGYTCSWERLLKEVEKCELLCANCHREVEDGNLTEMD